MGLNDDELLESIDQELFQVGENGFNSVTYVLDRMPDNLNVNYITKEIDRLEQQLNVVTKRLSQSIVEKESAYKEELKRVMDIQVQLGEAIKICSEARKGFARGRCNFTCASMKILANYRRREVIKDLVESILTIKTLRETNLRVKELIEEDEDYCGAIQLCIECQRAVQNLRHYKCVNELSGKLQDMLESIEQHIDTALSKMGCNFNAAIYGSLQRAYQLLGKTQTCMDSLLMHFASSINDKAFTVVYGYVELCCQDDSRKRIDNFRRKDYKQLCQYVTDECFMPCLIDLNKAMWNILLNYKRVIRYHQSVIVDSAENENEDSNFDRRFVKQKLEHGLGRIWQEMVSKLRTLISSHDVSSCSFDELMTILSVCRRMIDIGQEFCGSQSLELEECLHQRTIDYFSHYHSTRLDELRMYIENESWAVCPVRRDFSFSHLHEFRFLKKSSVRGRLGSRTSSVVSSPDKSSSKFFSDKVLSEDYCGPSPFDNICQEGENNDATEIFSDHFDLPDEDCGEESENYSTEESPIVTNTALYILRLIGKYMQIMFVLEPIAFDILLSIFHLIDFYFYVVYVFFVFEISDLRGNCLSNKLKACLQRIETSLRNAKSIDNGGQNVNRNGDEQIFFHSAMLDSNDLNQENLYGLANRVVGIESMIFLASVLIELKDQLRDFVPEEKHSLLEQYYSQTIAVAPDLRNPGYMLVAIKSISYETIINLMENVRWDIRDIPSMHNSYVDNFVRELKLFDERLKKIISEMNVKVDSVKEMLWTLVIKLANRSFVEGFSSAKKCTPAGRAAMQLDIQQFLSEVEKLTRLKPIPEKELVEEYIKAYYLIDDALEQWINNRSEYTPKQILALVQCITSEKKAKNRLMSLIESKFGAIVNSNQEAKSPKH